MNFTFSLSTADVETISEALNALPFGRVNGLVKRMQDQVNQQLQPQGTPVVKNSSGEKDPGE